MKKAESVSNRKSTSKPIVAVDLYCGVGGLTRGLLDSGIQVVAGYDIDEVCRYPYEHNNSPAVFKNISVANINGKQLAELYPPKGWRVLVGCAPCQPFSRYTQGQNTESDEKWGLLSHFGRLIEELRPDVVSMENVPELQRHSVYEDFLSVFERLNYNVSTYKVYCPDYGIPQQRTRLVLFASTIGHVEIIPPTHTPDDYVTVKQVIGSLPKLKAGRICEFDPLHRSARLSHKNIRRIQYSKPGGSWHDWPDELIAKCHRKKKGETYVSVYGRMKWNEPSPTITTQFYGFGNGRFGHPRQDRAISLREGAVLQSFPLNYEFVEKDGRYCFKTVGRMIGNAVPVRLGAIVGKSIKQHMEGSCVPQ